MIERRPTLSKPARRSLQATALASVLAIASTAVMAQSPPANPNDPLPPSTPPATGAVDAPAPPPRDAQPRPGGDASTPAAQRVEITGGREADQRRQSTASKIVIGREEIDRFGDSTVTEVLKRLPGVTMGGVPGRGGGNPRMRGMGGGNTQLLLNGERLPPGFSIDSIAPEQIERIEVLRAPTAETGARAIAGTINIVMREGFRKKLNDLKIGFEERHGALSPGLSWTHNDSLGEAFVYTGTAIVFTRNDNNDFESFTLREQQEPLSTVSSYRVQGVTRPKREGFNLNARLQWRLGEGHSLVLMPMGILSDNRSTTAARRDQFVGVPELASSRTEGGGRFTMQRLNTQYNRTVGEGIRLDMRLNGGSNRWRGVTQSRQYDAADTLLTTIDNDTRWRDDTVSFVGKASTVLGSKDHNLVVGSELEDNRRTETRITLQDGRVPSVLDDFGENLQARVRRVALYVQDEWNLTPQWGVHAGLRWEGIDTRGSGVAGSTLVNRSNVTTPLLHAVYKLDAQRRDQVRASLTRSYRTPTLPQLISRPFFAEINSLTTPDRYGNPNLKPELAVGVDLAFERYLADGGVLSANLFHRRIRDVIRTVVTVDPDTGRAASRPQNIGGASTSGLELEAKFRLDQFVREAPPVDLRVNASVFDSSVDGIQGPDNRIEGQPRGVLNLGADYRWRGTPLTVGGNLNWTPGVTTRLADSQITSESRKLVADLYGLWAFDAERQLRVSAGNFLPRDYTGVNRVEGGGFAQTTSTIDRTQVSWNVRFEIKL